MLAAADTLGRAQLAALFTAGYEDYFVPVQVDEQTFGSIVDAWDVDLGRSRVALRDGEPVGFALLAVRGERSWIGGLGVVTAARRGGLGRELMEAVLAEATDDVTLEVIEQNEPAIRLYDDLGFERTRILEVWSLAADAPASTAREADRDEADATIVELRRGHTPWQRDDGSLGEGLEAFAVDGGAALVRVREGHVSIAQLEARDQDAATELLAAARARGASLHFVNVPEGDPASAALRALGGTIDLRQYEMALRTRSSATTG